MKITIVCDVLGDPNNGTSIAAYNLIDHMLKKGHDVHVVCPDQDKKSLEGYYVVPVRNFYMFNGYVQHNGVVLPKKDDLILLKAIRGSDIVHIMIPFALGKRAAQICHKFNIPCTAGFHVQPENVTSHFFAQNIKWVNHRLYKYFYKNLYRLVDGIHYPSQFIQNKFESTIGIKTKGFVISNGISKDFRPKPAERPSFLNGKILILFTGRLTKEKSHPILIKAVNYSKYRDEIQLIFAGKGPQESHLKKLAKKEKLPNLPIFQFFSREEIINTINVCDLYVHPANIDIEPISCMEAISGGLVPIVTDSKRCGTSAFAIDDKNLFKAGDYKDLAKKIDYWIDNPDKLKERKEQYSNFVKSHDREYCMNKMEEMFFEVISRKKNDAQKEQK